MKKHNVSRRQRAKVVENWFKFDLVHFIYLVSHNSFIKDKKCKMKELQLVSYQTHEKNSAVPKTMYTTNAIITILRISISWSYYFIISEKR